MNSGSAFALKPKGGVGESISFTLHMWIPAIGCIFFSCAFIYMAYYTYTTNKPPNTYDGMVESFLWLACAVFFFGIFLLSRWRSVRIFPDGSVELNHPLFFVRKRERHPPGSVWLDVARKVPATQSRKQIKHHKANTKLQLLNTKHPEILKALEHIHWKPILVIHDGTKCFVLVLDKEGVIEEYQQFLNDEYNLLPSGTNYIVRYGGITDSGRV